MLVPNQPENFAMSELQPSSPLVRTSTIALFLAPRREMWCTTDVVLHPDDRYYLLLVSLY